MAQATLTGWRFDPAFSNTPGVPVMPRDWEVQPDGRRGGSALALNAFLMQVTLIDGTGDGILGAGDSLVLDGVSCQIDETFRDAEAVIDGKTWSLVTIFATLGPTADGQRRVVSFPLVDGQIAAAFGGDVTSIFVGTDTKPVLLPAGSVPCLTRGTLIDTPAGPVPVEDLEVGDLVSTRDAGAQPVRWICAFQLKAMHLRQRPELCPVLIPRGAFGPGLPNRDLRVSPRHRMLLRSPIAGRLFAANEVLVAARHLVGVAGIRRDTTAASVQYFHLVTTRHAIIRANGAETETMFPGPHALNSLPPTARQEVEALFPRLHESPPAAARPFIVGRQARILIARHRREMQALVAG